MEADDQGATVVRRTWRNIALFAGFVLAVVGAASAVGGRYRALHGADFFTGVYLDARFAPPPRLRGAVTLAAHSLRWPLAPGSGGLDVRFESRRVGRSRFVTAVRVAPGSDVLDGVDATVRVIDYDTVTLDADGRAAAVGHVTLECLERAGDGEHPHRLELRGDGTWVLDPR
jgi:hypothetical protein